MLGAIIGDIVGSRFEHDNHKDKSFDLFADGCRPTDDSTMTLAIAQGILKCGNNWSQLPANAVISMRDLGRRYPYGYGGRFLAWIHSSDPHPYNSWGNGAGMRVSPCGWAGVSLENALRLSDKVTAVTHNHPEGMKGARAITTAVYLARNGAKKEEIKKHIEENYYPLNFTIHSIRPKYGFDVSCQGSVPQAIQAFLESDSFEDAIRNAISIGGDSDTIAAMAGSIAEAFYGIPPEIRETALQYLDADQLQIVKDFEEKYGIVEDKGFRPKPPKSSTVKKEEKKESPKKEINFKNTESLQHVVNVVNEAAVAVEDKNRVIADSPIADVLGAVIGAGLGGVGSFAALYGLGVVGLSAAGITSALAAAGALVGGGMAAGVFVLAAPVAALGAAGYGIASHIRNQRFQQEKERLYKEAIKKHEAIIRALKEEADASKERIDYLQSLNVLLQRAIHDLKADLGK